MGDLQVDLNAALVAVKKKCVDLEETVKREDLKPQNRGRGYLGVKRYIYALTTKPENNLLARGRSLTRVYVEQKYYRSKSVPSPDQVQRLEDCTQDYGPNGEQRLEFTETIDAPLDELIKEDQSHHQMVSRRLPQGHAEWDHELAVYEEDGVSGLLEDRTMTLRAGDHPFGMNQFSENAVEVSQKIAEFFGSQKNSEETTIRSREMSLSVHPVYHDTIGSGAYTSYGMVRSKSTGNVAPRLETINKTTNSVSNLYWEQTRNDHDSKYGHYVTGYGRFGEAPLPPPKNPEVMPKLPKLPKKEEHIYAEPIVVENRRDTVIFKPKADAEVANTSSLHTTSHVEEFARTSTYERKYDFKTTFPPEVELPEGYHDYYDPSKFMFLDSQGYYRGNITRPLHYSYGRDTFEKYSDYSGSRKPSPVPLVEPEPEPIYITLHRTEDLPKSTIHVSRAYPDYYDKSTRIILTHCKDPEHLKFEQQLAHPDYYDNAARILLHYTHDLEHQEIHVAEYPEYIDAATRYPVLERTYDLVHDPIVINEYPDYKPYETQEVLIDFADDDNDDDHVYDEIYEPYDQLKYHQDVEHTVYCPEVPYYPPPPPPPVEDFKIEEIHVATPVHVIEEIEEPPIPAERHYDDLYVGQDALDVSVSPAFGKTSDQKNLGLEKSVHDRVREMEASLRSDERERMEEAEKRRRYEERQAEIREARLAEEKAQLEEYNAYKVEEESKNTPAPQPQAIQVPDVFVMPAIPAMPEKPKRTWQPPPKEVVELDEHEDKPLGPVIFHELIYLKGILRQKYQEEHSVTTRPVAHPVSRANSRPSTPGPEFREIDFPRLDEVGSPRGHADSTGNVDYVQKHIERYNANDAQDSSQHESHHHSHVHTVSAEHKEHHHHHHHHDHAHHAHRDSVVYDEPSHDVVYDVPPVDHEHHHHHHHHKSEHHHHHHQHDHVQGHTHTEIVRQVSDEEQQHLEQLKLQQQAAELRYQLAKTNNAIRRMSKSNKWAESEVTVGKQQDSSSHHSSTTTTSQHHSVLHHSNSLNRQNIPAPLTIQNGNSRNSSHELHHVHYSDDTENHNHNQIHVAKSTTSLEYSPVNVGHVKNLTLKFNKVDEKPITTEQVIYRVRAAPPGHNFQNEVKPRPRSMPPVPLDEVELHEHGERDHMTRHHQEMVKEHAHIGDGVTVNSHQIGGGVSVVHLGAHHNSHYHHVINDDEPTVKVRRVYKALEDTSMLSPVSMTQDEILYDVPADAHAH